MYAPPTLNVLTIYHHTCPEGYKEEVIWNAKYVHIRQLPIRKNMFHLNQFSGNNKKNNKWQILLATVDHIALHMERIQ